VDIAGLVKGAAEGQGLGNQFLSHIRDVDVILHVIRDFEAEGVPRAPDSKNPKDDALIVETELALKDLETTERAKKQKVSSSSLLPAPDSLLLSKPTIYVVNVQEGSDLSRRSDPSMLRGKTTLFVCAKIEEEISRLSKSEQKEFLSAYGLERSGLDRIITECFSLLGLISFFTAGKIEVRAWPVKGSSRAPLAAGTIHSDFERLFIRAEIIEWQKLCDAGSWQDAKEQGWIRTEGREYVVQDGEVCNFLIGKP
jgi:ribosome-binding ATPase YchF (GTP1/OBG family)